MAPRSTTPLIAILRGITPPEVRAQVRALIDNGIATIEVPTNSPDWIDSVRLALDEAGDDAMVGAGTMVDAAHVERLAASGARLMVTPNTDPALIARAHALGLEVAAGFATPSEAFAAIAAGARMLKLFPAAHFGPSYVRALKAVLPPDVPVYAVGGIDADNLASFLQAGCAGAGLGSDLYRPGQDAATTARKAAGFLQALRSATS